MLNCAQGAFVTRAASLAKAQHRAARAADEREGLRGAGPPPADAVPRGKRGKGGESAEREERYAFVRPSLLFFLCDVVSRRDDA